MALYAADFVLVNATYIALRWAVANQLRGVDLQMDMARLMKVRAFFHTRSVHPGHDTIPK